MTKQFTYKEVWRTIDGYSLYDVSNFGRVRSWNKGQWGVRDKPRILKHAAHFKGYFLVVLIVKPKRKTFSIHRLDNLRWDTPKNNQADRVKHGTASKGRVVVK